MASGLPVVASDLLVHKEVCGDAAQYFQRFSPESLAKAVARIAGSSEFALQLSIAGGKRSRDFNWAEHVNRLLALATHRQGTEVHQHRRSRALSIISRAS
jgi:glycosyltransferase involved in cell wall biosynthesis